MIGELICLKNTFKLPVRLKCATLGSNGIIEIINEYKQK